NYTNNCYIDHNDCSHVNRQTDPSDCAAILLIVSNNNTVEYNDLTYSGDGVFLGQYEHSGVPNNNYFAYNDCSFSPHNAIEATFADGNIYKYNKCNYSHYGFWLGYSFNSLVEGNEIIGNRYLPNDEFLIRTKLAGNLVWQPVATDGPRHTVMNAPPCDMAEPDANWQIYADPGYGHRFVETLEWDYEVKKVGRAAVKMVTPRGWDVAINYRPPGDSVALWSLSESDTLFLWIRTIKNPPFGFQACHIRVGCYNHGYYKYAVSESVFTNAHKHWSRLAIPLRGSRTFHRTEEGFMDLNQVSYVEIHADTWGFGYTLWGGWCAVF
ncbi:MAG: right-handed parallel beta-helix repeat-containing protein, partial [Bacteroidales bacterium]|nr:right-handed parallel beta-helix repeat-containing protein [Bacteroidales bacterium]